VGTNADKRRRQKENRAVGAPPPRSSNTRWWILGAVVVALVAVGAFVLFAGDDSSEDVEGDATSDEQAADDTTPTDDTAPAEDPTGVTKTITECPPAEGTVDRADKFSGPPPMCIDAAANTYAATFKTNEGDFTAELDADEAPNTVNNFVVLARERYYDGVPFHRIVPGFVIQAGDGDGEPWGNNDLGYEFEDELPDSSDAYTEYSLAMANSGPNTNGSQFFVVLPGGGAQLQPLYSHFGQVTDGQDVVDAIGALGPDDQATTGAVINTVEITETPK
jgi:cyclophilin family peptidyl-prolyl cis-trans isomerase